MRSLPHPLFMRRNAAPASCLTISRIPLLRGRTTSVNCGTAIRLLFSPEGSDAEIHIPAFSAALSAHDATLCRRVSKILLTHLHRRNYSVLYVVRGEMSTIYRRQRFHSFSFSFSFVLLDLVNILKQLG